MDAYKMVKFMMGKTEHHLVCTGPTGSSGLAAIINSFSINYDALIPGIYAMDEKGSKKVINLLIDSLSKVREIKYGTNADLLAVINEHQTRLHVSPTLLGPLSFSGSHARYLFAYLHLKLLHGWVLDPSVSIYQSVKSFSRANLSEFLASIEDQEDQQKNMLLVQELLNAEEDSQLTEYGFRSLFEEIAEMEFAIVFCYRRFNLVYRRANKLYMVETDLTVRNRYTDVQWRSFDGDIPESCIYLKQNFTLVKDHEASPKATEWIQSGQNVSRTKKRKLRRKELKEHADKKKDTTTDDDNESSQQNLQSAVGEKKSQVGSENIGEASSKSGTIDQTSVEKQIAGDASVNDGLPSESGTLPGDSPSRIVAQANPSNSGTIDEASEKNMQSASLEKQSAGDASVDDGLSSESGTLPGDSPSRIVAPSMPNPDSVDSSGGSSSGSIQGKENLTCKVTDKRTENPEEKISYNPEFLEFLIQFRHQDMDYFKGLLEAFKTVHKPWFFVPYDFILQWNERLALQIQDNYPRIYEELRRSVLEYLKLNGLECPNVELKMFGVPEPRSTQMFEDFFGSINLFEVYQVSDGDQEEVPSFDSRRMCLGILKCLIHKFETRKCWAGKWTVANIRVKNSGSEFIIIDCEDMDLDPENGYADLVNFTTTILARFANAEGDLPAYFDDFGVDCQRFPSDVKDKVKMGRFLQLIGAPLALNPHLVRSTLLCESFVAANSHSTGDPPQYVPLAGKNDCDHDWRFLAKDKGVFQKVYEHQKVARSRVLRTKYFHDPWQISHWSVLKYSRVFITHVLRHTKGHDLAQKIKDIAIVNILLSRKLGKHIAALFRYIVLECGVSDGIFSSPWRHYVASECLDKPHGNIGLEAASAIDKILSSDSDEDEVFAEVYAQLGIPSSEVHKSTVVSDADLKDFSLILIKKGRVCQVKPDGTLEIKCQVIRDGVRQYIRVYKQEGGRGGDGGSSSSSSSYKSIVVEGPYCDDYSLVFEHLCTWLKL